MIEKFQFDELALRPAIRFFKLGGARVSVNPDMVLLLSRCFVPVYPGWHIKDTCTLCVRKQNIHE